ncbi:MAG TPA: 30S ribosomal protein S12 methylthiotransferase RimO, partial [Flavobacteriales bacterium]|nr:30S ribosomal protein S12 methylthiotransferase RimO [Flavobacteriales bacterium]
GDIRNRVPEIALRTTLICGFPGETEAHHQDMLNWTERMRFDRVGCFTYSHEENTHAYSLQDDVPEEIKKKRVDEIMTQQAGISFELNQKFVGTQQRVLIDRLEDGQWIGRTEWDSPDVDNEVRITAPDDVHLRIGDFAMAHIDSATEFDLHGRLA